MECERRNDEEMQEESERFELIDQVGAPLGRDLMDLGLGW